MSSQPKYSNSDVKKCKRIELGYNALNVFGFDRKPMIGDILHFKDFKFTLIEIRHGGKVERLIFESIYD